MRLIDLKGGQAVTGLLFSFVLVAILAVILAPFLLFVDIGVNATQNATHGELMTTIINLYPLFLVLVVLISIVVLITGRQI